MFAGHKCGAGADGDHSEDPHLHCRGEGSVFLHCGGEERRVCGVEGVMKGDTGGLLLDLNNVTSKMLIMILIKS